MSSDPQSERDLKGEIVRTLLRKTVVGKHRKQLETVVNWFPRYQENEVRELLEEMVDDPESPVESYGKGDYSNIFIDDYDDAKKFVEDQGLNSEWL